MQARDLTCGRHAEHRASTAAGDAAFLGGAIKIAIVTFDESARWFPAVDTAEPMQGRKITGLRDLKGGAVIALCCGAIENSVAVLHQSRRIAASNRIKPEGVQDGQVAGRGDSKDSAGKESCSVPPVGLAVQCAVTALHECRGGSHAVNETTKGVQCG